MNEPLFPGFSARRVPTARGEVFARVGGTGPALLLLHGYPQSHLMWHEVAPTGEIWARADAAMAVTYWHWGFLAQPAPLPERLIGADPGAFFDHHVRRLGLGAAPGHHPEQLMKAYRQLLDDPGVVEAVCEDYRAGATVDREHDDADLGRRRIECPLLVLWSATGALPRFYGDVLDVWRPWASDLRGWGVPGSHFLAEDRPEQVAGALTALMDEPHDHHPAQLTGTRNP